MNEVIFVIFQLVVLIFSVMAHEVAHGLVADRLGDPTARLAGRLNFNPINHLDPVGSVLLPLLLYFTTAGSFVFGWAKPVPYNPQNLRDPKVGGGLIAAAGPLTNLLIALGFGILLRVFLLLEVPAPPVFIVLLNMVIAINILLAVFNLVPIPPLDGSKILFTVLPVGNAVRGLLEQYGFFILLLFLFFGFGFIRPVVDFLFGLIGV